MRTHLIYLNLNQQNGRFPQNSSEVLISNHIITNGKTDLKIGDKLKIDIGDRKTIDGFDLSGHNPYTEEEKIIDTKTYEFTIVRQN